MCTQAAQLLRLRKLCAARKQRDGVVLPADLGQGVNSALLDVGTLSACLRTHSRDVDTALTQFEEMRLPENRALVRMNQVRTTNSVLSTG